MKKVIFFFFLLILPQVSGVLDIQSMGGTGDDVGYAIINVSDGYIIAGETQSFSAQIQDIWVVKVSNTGEIEWEQRIGGDGYAGSFSASNGGILNLVGIALEEPGATVAVAAAHNSTWGIGNTDGYVVNLNISTGQVLWQNNYGDPKPEGFSDIVPATGSGFYVAGTYNRSTAPNADVDLYNGWVVKVEPGGTINWSRLYNGSQDDYITGLTRTSDGGVITIGHSYSYPEQGAGDLWVQKLNSGGDILWSKLFGVSGGLEQGIAVAEGSDGTTIGVLGNSNNDIWVLRINHTSGGDILWQNRYGGASPETAGDIASTANGGYIIAATTQSFNAMGNDAWIFSLNSSGTIQSENRIGGSGNDFAYGITGTNDGSYAVTGKQSSWGAGGFDTWILKINSSGAIANCSVPISTSATTTATAVTNTSTGWLNQSGPGLISANLTNLTTSLAKNGLCLISTKPVFRLRRAHSSLAGNSTTSGTYNLKLSSLGLILNNRSTSYYNRLGFLENKYAPPLHPKRSFTFLINTTNTTVFNIFNTSHNSHNKTRYNDIIDAIDLNSSFSGVFTSAILDAGIIAAWKNITWESEAYGELPNFNEEETSFAKGNTNMSGNVLLMHMNNASGENDTYFRDWSGRSTNLVCDPQTSACPTFNISGKLNNAYRFDGNNDSMRGNLTPEMRTKNVTLMAWVFPYTNSAGQTIVALEPIGAEIYARGVWLRMSPSGNAQFRKGIDNFVFSTVQSSQAIPIYVWSHIAAISDGEKIRIYINGYNDSENSSQTDISWADTGGDTPSPPQIYIGSYRLNSTLQPQLTADFDFFTGLIDEVAIWNRSLSASEIFAIYKRGATRLNLSIRSCKTKPCVEPFNDINDTPGQNLTINSAEDRKYIQYRFNLSTDNQSISPALYNVSIGYTKEDHLYMNLTDGSIQLGDLELGRTEDSEGKGDFFNITNDGTIPVHLYGYAQASPFSSPTGGANTLPTDAFKFHANSSAGGTPNTTYGAVPGTFGARTLLVSNLPPTQGSNHALIGVRVTVPSDEAVGSKAASIILIAEQS